MTMQIGDSCKLKSGGPLMTIGKVVPESNTVWVYWFNSVGPLNWQLVREQLMVETLDLVVEI